MHHRWLLVCPCSGYDAVAFRLPGPPPPLPCSGGACPSGADWESLRECEAGGDYTAVSRSGKYRGAYQFDRRTWAAYGPPGDPAAASPAEQDRRAYALFEARGHAPWPLCGRHLR